MVQIRIAKSSITDTIVVGGFTPSSIEVCRWRSTVGRVITRNNRSSPREVSKSSTNNEIQQ